MTLKEITFEKNITPFTRQIAEEWYTLSQKLDRNKKAQKAILLDMNRTEKVLLAKLDLSEGVAIGTNAVVHTTHACDSSSWKNAFGALQSLLTSTFSGTGRIGKAIARQYVSTLADTARNANCGIKSDKPRIKLVSIPR